MRHFAITGIVTASWISRILSGSAMRATPPSARMSAGTRSSAITATAPASSATFACSALTTSMITPPLSISARPLFTRIVPYSAMTGSLAMETAIHGVQLVRLRRDRPDEDGVPAHRHDVREMRPQARRRMHPKGLLRRGCGVRVLGEGDSEDVARGRGRLDPALVGKARDEADLDGVRRHPAEAVRAQAADARLRRERRRV